MQTEEIQNAVDAIGKQKALNKQIIELSDELLRLEQNPSFKKVILQTYLVDSALTLVERLGQPDIGEQEQKDLDKKITSIGVFKNFLAAIHRRADEARNNNAACDEALVELYNENEEQ